MTGKRVGCNVQNNLFRNEIGTIAPVCIAGRSARRHPSCRRSRAGARAPAPLAAMSATRVCNAPMAEIDSAGIGGLAVGAVGDDGPAEAEFLRFLQPGCSLRHRAHDTR